MRKASKTVVGRCKYRNRSCYSYDLSVLSMSVSVSKQNLDTGVGWVSGWGEIYPGFFGGFLEFSTFAKTINYC